MLDRSEPPRQVGFSLTETESHMPHRLAPQIVLGILLNAVASPCFANGADELKKGLAAFDAFRFEEALVLLTPLAGNGVPQAELRLGQMYVYGWGVSRDYVKGAQLLLPAAEGGVAEAQYELGKLWVDGRGLPQSDAEMVKWHTRSANQGFHKALNAMGEMHAWGYGVKIDYVRSYMWYTLAIRAGDKDQAHARDYVAGKMTPEQIAEAERLVLDWRAQSEFRASPTGD
jgi:TPR repeat protein